MKVAVIGAGVIGITTAYELALDGHDVTVFEQRSAAAAESSFANAGLVAPSYVTPWAVPGMPGQLLRNLWNRHAAVKLSLPLSRRDLTWISNWANACKQETYLVNLKNMQRLAFYSSHRLRQLTAELKLDYDSSVGYMLLLRSSKDALLIEPYLQILKDAGVALRQMDAASARLIEPALNPDTDFFGAVHFADDDVANCRQFVLLLKREALRMGVNFEFNTSVAHLERGQPTHIAIVGENLPRRFDRVVMCAGLASADLLIPLGLKIPMTAVYGYSISATIREPLNAPRSAIMDEHYKVSISRLGNRVRVAGVAEIGGSVANKRTSSLQILYKVLNDWFPGAAQRSNLGAGLQEWKGARPMTSDGPPLIGQSNIPGVWLNLGHGNSGWALSCGSARALADLISGRQPEIDMDGLGLGRLVLNH